MSNINVNTMPAERRGGKTVAQMVCEDAARPIVVKEKFEAPEVKLKPPSNNTKRKYICCMCGTEYAGQSGNFLTSGKSFLWRGNGGYLPICKNCCQYLFEYLTDFYCGNEEHALKHMCCMFGWYYNEVASAMTKTQVKVGQSRVALYPAKTTTTQVAKCGQTYLDTVKHDYEESRKILSPTVTPVGEEEGEEEEEFPVTKEMIRVWGKGFSSDQYQFLEEEYADWIGRNVCNTKTQEELFRNLALAQLDIRMARQKGGDVDKAQRALQGLMNSANILPKQTSENLLADTQTFGTLLKKFEETRPLPEPDPEWQDVDGIRHYIDTWFYGHLSKTLGIKNENAAKYAEEVGRYTVDRPSDEQLQQESDLLALLDGNGSRASDGGVTE